VAQINEILDQLENEAFLNHLGFSPNRRGKWYVNCPFCGGKEKLSIDIKTGLWKCFKCEEKGNMITLYAKLNTCNNFEAVKAIKEFAGIKDDDQPKKSGRKGKSNNVVQLKNKQEFDFNPSEPDPGASVPESSPIQAPMASLADIYNEFIRLAQLTPEHRQELHKKRGFSDATIDDLKFRSCGEYLKQVIEQLRDKFSDDDLQDSGILFEVNGTLTYNDQLLGDRVIIPYLDAQDDVYHMRPHKLGFQGFPPEVYCEMFASGSEAIGKNGAPKEAILTEGEFKAAALRQLGLLGLAAPGISSFGSKHFERLVSFLKLHDIKRVYIIYDNEIKDNPELPNFKERPENRWDADYWTYMMAYSLGKEGFIARCGRLPDEWRQNGKIDFDGALAAGKTREDIQRVLSKTMLPGEYIDSLPEEAQRILNRKIAKHFMSIPVKREFNRYVITRAKGTETYEDTISNFVINIKSSCFTPDGVIRSVELVNEFGEHSTTFSLTPAEMAGLTEMKKFCLGRGNYIFEGTGSDLNNVWKLEFSRDMGDMIYMPDRIGYINEADLWLFGNLAIHRGKVYKPDKDGIMWIKNKGYKPQSIRQNSSGETSEDAIPSISEKPIDLADLAQKIKQTVGGYEAYMGIGWAVATIFGEDIFQQYKCMPILFPHGKRESGKSTFMRWVMALFGVDIDGVGIAETTQNFIARALSYYSSLGCWFDEYRNEPRVIQKDGYFRSAYNRQLSGKGTATAFQTKGFSVHAAVAVSGEELPRDNGLFTRLIPLQFSSYKRDRTHFNWLNRHSDDFSYLTYHLVTNYEALKPKILQTIGELKEALLKRDITDRTAENWAICAGAFFAVVAQDKEFIRWVEQSCQEIKRTGEKEHMLNQFLNDLSIMVNSHELNSTHIYAETIEVDGETVRVINLWFSGIYGMWAKFYRSKTGREPFDEQSVRKYITDEPYYCKTDKIRFSDMRKRGVQITRDDAPESVVEACEMIESRQKTYDQAAMPTKKASNDTD
jgi:hypothetical protein